MEILVIKKKLNTKWTSLYSLKRRSGLLLTLTLLLWWKVTAPSGWKIVRLENHPLKQQKTSRGAQHKHYREIQAKNQGQKLKKKILWNLFNYFITSVALVLSCLTPNQKLLLYTISCCFQASTCLTSTALTWAAWTSPALPAFPPRTDAPNPPSPWQPFAGLSPVSPSPSNTEEPRAHQKSCTLQAHTALQSHSFHQPSQ